jgi:molybdopterin converting factor small subunit/tRNA threonylcarbamoyladenosine modification (KEOPS) complex Cgi121 subunit
LITIKLLGGAKKSFDTDQIRAELDGKTIAALLDHLLSIKPTKTLNFDTKNILVAVNGVDSSALNGRETVLRQDDVVSIIPVIHGGAARIQFKIDKYTVELFGISYGKAHNYDFLESARSKFPNLVLEGISSRCILSPLHAKKIIRLSLYAQKHNLLLSKKLQTDILLRFAATTQISDAVKKVGINGNDEFTLIAIGAKASLNKLYEYLQSHLKEPHYTKNSVHLRKLFGISKKQIQAASSDVPLEDLLVEKAAVLIK